MKPKLEIAADLLKTICSLELSPIEVKSLTLMWLSYYPFLLEDFGWEIQVHARLQNIMTEIEKLKVIMEQAQLEEKPVVDLLAQAESNTQTSVATETSPEESLVAEAEVGEGNLSEDATQPAPPEKPEKQRRKRTASAHKPKPDTIAEVPPCKGYSKYGKKLGRPPRQKSVTEEISKTVQIVAARKTEVSAPAKVEPEAILPPVTPPPVTPPPVTPPSVTSPPEVVSQKQIDKLKYGKQYEYDLLYLVNNLYARSPFKLQEEAGVKPVGVVVPYMHQNRPYEIVVYYADEQAKISLSVAQKYARNKLLPYKGRFWRVKKLTDDAFLRPVLSDINAIFKKMGGDELKGDYVDGRGYGVNTKVDPKIRYVCNIPLFEQQGDELETE